MVKIKIEKSLILTADILVLCFTCCGGAFSVNHVHKFLKAVDNKNLERSFVIANTKKLMGITIGIALAFIYFFLIDKYLERHLAQSKIEYVLVIGLITFLASSFLFIETLTINNFHIERKADLESHGELYAYHILYITFLLGLTIWMIYKHCSLEEVSTDLPITKLLDCTVQKVINCFKIEENYD